LWSRMQRATMSFELSLPARQPGQRESSMKKTKKIATDELRPDYRRSDFGALVRWKFIKRLHTSSNVIVLEPEVAGLFPNAAAVNSALRSLAEIAKRAGAAPRRSR